MEEQNQNQPQATPQPALQTTAGQGFGIAGLIIGLIALIIAFIPCIGLIALVPGVIAVVLSFIGLAQANQNNGAKGLIIAALVVSILATTIAAIWGIVIGGVSRDSHRWLNRVERVIERSDRESVRELETSLKVLGEELEKTFGDRDDFDPEVYEFGEEITDEEFERVMQEYETVVREFARLAREVEAGNVEALVTYSTVSLRAASLAATMIRVGPKLTEEQQQRLQEVSERYEKALEAIDK